MICYNLNKDFKQCGAKYLGRWVQRIVFVNKSQVNQVFRDGNLLSFTLNDGGRGVSFVYSETFNQILGNYEVVEKFNYKQFRHNVQASLSGLDYDTMGLNNGEYFVALMDSKSRVYIFGFDYLLKPEDYLYETHQMNTITLRSSDIGLEDNIPLTYVSNDIGGDFMNNFEGAELIETFGEFSDDFNNDFYI